ncbi:MAG: CAP domain-containing protein [Hyphomicrobiaceae bacterium]|nr:CAP domain-containing protein [Hyphomicrobiaceae bacterium]
MTPDLPAVEIAIVEQTNKFRAQKALPPVNVNHLLTNAARAYAEYLARTRTFGHQADGREPAERATTAGYSYCRIAENLAMALDSRGFATDRLATEMVEGWINSPGHRANLLAPAVTDIGVGVARVPDKHPKFVSVQLFGRPQSAMVTFQVSNATTSSIGYAFGGENHDIEPGFAVRHSTCDPADIAFEPIGRGSGRASPAGTYAAADGTIYLLKPTNAGGFTVVVTQKETVEQKPAKPERTNKIR